MIRGLKFRHKEEEVSYYPSSKNKGADQLRGLLISFFLLAYAKRWFSHDAAHIEWCLKFRIKAEEGLYCVAKTNVLIDCAFDFAYTSISKNQGFSWRGSSYTCTNVSDLVGHSPAFAAAEICLMHEISDMESRRVVNNKGADQTALLHRQILNSLSKHAYATWVCPYAAVFNGILRFLDKKNKIIFFSCFCLKHRLRIHVRTATLRR